MKPVKANLDFLGAAVISFSMIAIAVSQFTVAYADSNGGRGGGGAYEGHFESAGKSVLRAMKTICANSVNANEVFCKFTRKFSDAVAQAKVLPGGALTGSDGRPRDAGPDGSGNVLLNEETYSAKLKVADAAPGLVQVIAHEYFIAAMVETVDEYDVSSQLVNAFKSNFMDFNALLGDTPTVSPAVLAPLDRVRTGDFTALSSAVCPIHIEKDVNAKLVIITYFSSSAQVHCTAEGETEVFSCENYPCNQIDPALPQTDWTRVMYQTSSSGCPIGRRALRSTFYVADDGGVAIISNYETVQYNRFDGVSCVDPETTQYSTSSKWR